MAIETSVAMTETGRHYPHCLWQFAQMHLVIVCTWRCHSIKEMHKASARLVLARTAWKALAKSYWSKLDGYPIAWIFGSRQLTCPNCRRSHY